MLEYWQNGERMYLLGIGSEGKEGQIVILGSRVDWGSDPNPKVKPLSQYPYLSIFTIVEKKNDGIDGYYILKDENGNCIELKYSYHSSGAGYLYDAQEWLNWNAMRQSEKISRKQRKIEQLEGHIDLLKDILIKQGTRIVTEKQAENLGL